MIKRGSAVAARCVRGKPCCWYTRLAQKGSVAVTCSLSDFAVAKHGRMVGLGLEGVHLEDSRGSPTSVDLQRKAADVYLEPVTPTFASAVAGGASGCSSQCKP